LELGYRLAKLVWMENPSQAQYYSQMPLPEKPIAGEFAPTPNNPPWGIPAAIGVWLASVFFILIIPTIFLLPYLASQAMEMGSEEMIGFAKSDATSIFLQLIAILPAHFFTLVLAWWVVTRGRKFSFRQTLGWRRGSLAWWHYAVMLIGFLVIAGFVGRYFPEQDNDLIRMLRSSRSAVYLVALVATFTAPIVEEVIYRGLIYSAVQKTLGVPVAFVTATLLFSIVHVPQYYPSYSTIFLLCLLSVVLTTIRVWSGNLLPCIILHTLFNGLQSVLLILEPYTKSADANGEASIWLHLLR
jgi:membrane protease YdiL (CAAX protease family)